VVNIPFNIFLRFSIHRRIDYSFSESERYMLSPVCLSSVCLSVTFVHPTQPIEIFGNVSSPFGTLAIQ